MIGIKWDSNIVTLDIIPLVPEFGSTRDPFVILLNSVGLEGLAKILLDIIIDNEIYVPPEISKLVLELARTLLNSKPKIILNGFRDYSIENISYIFRLVIRIRDAKSTDERFYVAKQAIMALKGIVKTILGLIDSEFGRDIIKSIFADPSRKELAKLIAEIIRFIDEDKHNKFLEIIFS